MTAYEILLVDDDPLILKALKPALEKEGYRVTTADNGESAVEMLESRHFDILMTDLVMDAIDGIGVLKQGKASHPEIMSIILTGFGDIHSAIEALRLGADDYLLKPSEADEILFRVSSCVEKLELKRKLKAYEGILPVCCVCKKIRDDSGREPGTGEWMMVEKFIWKKAKLAVSSTYCPGCFEDLQREIEKI